MKALALIEQNAELLDNDMQKLFWIIEDCPEGCTYFCPNNALGHSYSNNNWSGCSISIAELKSYVKAQRLKLGVDPNLSTPETRFFQDKGFSQTKQAYASLRSAGSHAAHSSLDLETLERLIESWRLLQQWAGADPLQDALNSYKHALENHLECMTHRWDDSFIVQTERFGLALQDYQLCMKPSAG